MKRYLLVNVLAYLAFAVLIACLHGCGGGAGANPFVQAASCTPKVVTVALLGDSTQFGYDGTDGTQAANQPGAALQRAMDAQFGAGAVVVTNYGVKGSYSGQAPSITADVKVANYGINDMRMSGATVAGFSQRMSALDLTLVETQSPLVDRTWPEADYVAASKALGVPVADVNAYVLSLPNWQAMVPDGIHPNNALYGLIVTNVLAPAVARQVASLRCEAQS